MTTPLLKDLLSRDETITASFSRTTANPYINASGRGYRVVLRYQGRSMTVANFTVGSAHGEPTVRDVLECVLSDACTIENARGLDDFISELGFTSRAEASRVYNACLKQTDSLRRLLGDEFETWVFSDSND